MSEPPASSSESQPPASQGDGERSFPELTVGRGRIVEFALRRLKASLPLQASMAVAFMCYGALVFLTVTGQVPFASAAIVVLLSLASWFFLFWWYPVLERTQKAMDAPNHRWIPKALEFFASACVVVVHVLMLVIVIVQAGD